VSRLTPISRQEFIKRLLEMGFSGPYKGGKHEFMVKGQLRLTIPNLHHGEIGVDLLMRILRQANISREDWEG
jgi:predicted RNA binding protein YcfA (HicA-like mRNA interferase family)